jgi:flagellar biosynthesis protein FlhG
LSENLTSVYDNLFLRQKAFQNISVFISGAEHIGTSWSALTFAHALNIQKKRVLFVDANGNYSNIRAMLSLPKGFGLEDFITGGKTLNQLVFAYKNKDFNLLVANTGSYFLTEQPLGRLNIFMEDLNILSRSYQHTVIDLGAEFNDKSLVCCHHADNIILVCSENKADIIKTFDLIRRINDFGISAASYLVINKVNSFEDGYKIFEKINKVAEENGLKSPKFLGSIRVDTRIRDTIKNKELLLSRYPNSEAAVDVFSIAERFCLEMNNEQ